MSDEEYTTGVSIGNKVSEDGRAGVIIWFERGCSKACVSPKGARLIASHLLDWAEHAESWEANSDDVRKRDWMVLRSDPIETETRIAIKSTENRAPGTDPKTGEYSTAQMMRDEMAMGDTTKPLLD